MLKNNSHIHLAAELLGVHHCRARQSTWPRRQGVQVIGVTNYYDYRVYGEFAEARPTRLAIYPLFGLEIISLVDELVKIGREDQ